MRQLDDGLLIVPKGLAGHRALPKRFVEGAVNSARQNASAGWFN